MNALDELVERVEKRPPCEKAFRMDVERTFSVKGLGTVVTGIPVTGRIHVGDRVELLPGGVECGIRAIQCYKMDTGSLEANICGALVLRNVRIEDVRRGMTVAAPGVHTALVCLPRDEPSASPALRGRGE